MKVLRWLKLIAKSKTKWAKLPRVDIAVFDAFTGWTLTGIIPGVMQDYPLFFIDTRGESYHMPTFLAAFRQYILCKRKVPVSYLYFSMFIMKLGARICITNQDSNHLFYALDKRLPDVRFIALQQGLKNRYSIGKFANISGDYFAFGKAYATKLNNGVGDMVICGYTWGNMVKLRAKKLLRLCYVSSFSGQDLGVKIFKNVNYAEFIYPAVYSTLKEVDYFCSTQGIELVIASKTEGGNRQDREWDLYENILGRKPPLIRGDSYKLAGESELVVCDQSALGYQMLGRDCKVVFINLIAYYHREKSYRFGWPLALPKQGTFWTNKYDPEYIQNMLNHVWHMASEEWKDLITYYKEQFMCYDPGNLILLNHIKSILTSRRPDGTKILINNNLEKVSLQK